MHEPAFKRLAKLQAMNEELYRPELLEGRQIAVEAGTAARGSVMKGANGIGNQIIELLPNYRILIDPRVTMQE